MPEAPVSRRTLHWIDAVMALWVVLWVTLGVVSFVEVRGLESLSDTMQMAGESLKEAGDGLGTIAALPLVGGSIDVAAARVQELAGSTIEEARSSRTHIMRLSVLALLLGGLIPLAIGLAVYLPLRRTWVRRRAG